MMNGLPNADITSQSETDIVHAPRQRKVPNNRSNILTNPTRLTYVSPQHECVSRDLRSNPFKSYSRQHSILRF